MVKFYFRTRSPGLKCRRNWWLVVGRLAALGDVIGGGVHQQHSAPVTGRAMRTCVCVCMCVCIYMRVSGASKSGHINKQGACEPSAHSRGLSRSRSVGLGGRFGVTQAAAAALLPPRPPRAPLVSFNRRCHRLHKW